MKYKDIAYELESVKQLIIYENNKKEATTIEVPNSCHGDSRKYFDYEILSIKGAIKTSEGMDGGMYLKPYIIVILQEPKMEA